MKEETKETKDTKETKETTMIQIDKDTRKEFMLFKVKSDAKNIRDVLRLAIQKLKEEETKNVKLDKKPV